MAAILPNAPKPGSQGAVAGPSAGRHSRSAPLLRAPGGAMSTVATHHRHVPLTDTGTPAAGVPDSWRWRARELLADLRDLLVTDSPAAYDGWLAARGAGMLRERDALLSRLGTIGPLLLQEP